VADGIYYFVFTFSVPSSKSRDLCANAFKMFLRSLSEGKRRAVETDSKLTGLFELGHTSQSTRAERMVGLLIRYLSKWDILFFSAIPSSLMAEGIRFQNWAQARALWYYPNPPQMVRHNHEV
jgi:hypothetical protein